MLKTARRTNHSCDQCYLQIGQKSSTEMSCTIIELYLSVHLFLFLHSYSIQLLLTHTLLLSFSLSHQAKKQFNIFRIQLWQHYLILFTLHSVLVDFYIYFFIRITRANCTLLLKLLHWNRNCYLWSAVVKATYTDCVSVQSRGFGRLNEVLIFK